MTCHIFGLIYKITHYHHNVHQPAFQFEAFFISISFHHVPKFPQSRNEQSGGRTVLQDFYKNAIFPRRKKSFPYSSQYPTTTTKIQRTSNRIIILHVPRQNRRDDWTPKMTDRGDPQAKQANGQAIQQAAKHPRKRNRASPGLVYCFCLITLREIAFTTAPARSPDAEATHALQTTTTQSVAGRSVGGELSCGSYPGGHPPVVTTHNFEPRSL